MKPEEHAAKAYAEYRARCGLARQDDELDAEKFMVSVVPQIQLAVANATPVVLPPEDLLSKSQQELLMQDTENGQQSGQTGLEIGFKDGQVILQFDTAVRHFTLPAKQARMMAELIRKCSYQAEGRKKK